ncbi:hypothetical protein HMPREF2851_04190 [Actinomyces sp. HMSC064C12]|nr:hypothetical protein HMPREF2851_04190 [Actinomyces sp. HMSC064C12]
MTDNPQHPKRRSLSDRQAELGSQTGRGVVSQETSPSGGGVTSTPYTGQIPKITADQMTPQVKEGLGVATTGMMRAIKPTTSVPQEAQKSVPASPPNKKPPSSTRTLPADTLGKDVLTPTGWTPDYYAAFPLAIIPFLVGTLLAQPSWEHMPLFALWIVGYMCFNAIGLWLRSGLDHHYWAPARTYSAISAVLAVVNLIVSPYLTEWTVAFLPFAITAGWQCFAHNWRTPLTRLCTVCASSLILLVAFDVGNGFSRPFWAPDWLQHSSGPSPDHALAPAQVSAGWGWAGICALLMAMASFGTITYLRTLGRNGLHAKYVVPAAVVHVLLFLSAILGFGLGELSQAALVAASLYVVRMAFTPLTAKWVQQSSHGFLVVAVESILITLFGASLLM